MRFANEFGFCELNSFPGCNQIVISNHGYIYPHHQGKGHGTTNHRLRIQRAKWLGYDYVLCTVRSENTKECSILQKNDFKELDEFYNSKTKQHIKLFGKKILFKRMVKNENFNINRKRISFLNGYRVE